MKVVQPVPDSGRVTSSGVEVGVELFAVAVAVAVEVPVGQTQSVSLEHDGLRQ